MIQDSIGRYRNNCQEMKYLIVLQVRSLAKFFREVSRKVLVRSLADFSLEVSSTGLQGGL